MSRIYLDSCIIIYRVEGAAPYKEASDHALLSIGSGKAYISPLVRLECLVKPTG